MHEAAQVFSFFFFLNVEIVSVSFCHSARYFPDPLPPPSALLWIDYYVHAFVFPRKTIEPFRAMSIGMLADVMSTNKVAATKKPAAAKKKVAAKKKKPVSKKKKAKK